MTDGVADSRGDEHQEPRRRASNRWLLAAILATLAFALVVGYALANIYGYRPSAQTMDVGAEVAEDSEALVVAVARTPGGPGEWSNWARVIKYLSEELHRPVTVRYLAKEDESAEVISREKPDVAFVCAHTYLDLADAGATIGICTPEIDGESTARMMLLVRADDPATCFEDLKGSQAAASDKSSLGGYAYLQYLAKARGTLAEEYFSGLRLGETQESNLKDVMAGSVRVTVANSAQTTDWDLSKLKVIEQSEPFGCPPVIVRADMDEELRERITQVLLDMDAEEVLPADSHIDGFVELDESEYAFVDELRSACGHHDH